MISEDSNENGQNKNRNKNKNTQEKKLTKIAKQKQLCTYACSTIFVQYLCRCFARLQRETSENVLVTLFVGACRICF